MSLKKIAPPPRGGGDTVWKTISAILVAIIAVLLGIIFQDDLAAWVERATATGEDSALLPVMILLGTFFSLSHL